MEETVNNNTVRNIYFFICWFLSLTKIVVCALSRKRKEKGTTRSETSDRCLSIYTSSFTVYVTPFIFCFFFELLPISFSSIPKRKYFYTSNTSYDYTRTIKITPRACFWLEEISLTSIASRSKFPTTKKKHLTLISGMIPKRQKPS